MQKLNTVRELIDFAAQTYADKPAYVEQVNGEMKTVSFRQVKEDVDALVTEDNQTLAIALFVEGDTGEEALANARASIAELNKTLPAYKRLMSVRLTAEPFATNATGKKIR